MAKVCTNCGSPIGDGEKFCTVCGTPVQIQRVESDRYCTQCGSLLKPTAKFCVICGKAARIAKPKVEKVEEVPATMDEVSVPEITADTFASSKELAQEKFDGFEAAVMPDIPEPAPAPAPAPVPTPVIDAAPARPSTPDYPTQSEAVQQAMQNAASVEAMKQAAAAPGGIPAPNDAPQQFAQPQAPQFAQQAPQFNQPQPQFNQPQQPQQQFAQPPINPANPQAGYQQPVNMANPMNGIPQENISKGSGSKAVPIILALLILIVIVADVVLFGLKGKNKDDDKGSKKNITVVYDADYI